ncbi:brachyurin-like [Bacillus rossius redtenbacheri]|uniref:brachyurin-like n=1 Tax=Bacillus rossius redtenbacheri TaxID=93214 RepID=UPI002FDE94FB
MKVLVVLSVFLVASQAKVVQSWASLQHVNSNLASISAISHDNGEGVVAPAPRIVGGAAVAQGQIPWQALLVMDGSSVCSGALVSSDWVLTTAHCLDGSRSFAVTLGATSRTAGQANAVTEYAKEAIVHASFNAKTYANDIGALRLQTLVDFTDYIDAVQLPSLSQASTTFEGATALVSGYGRTSSSSQAASDVLLQAEVQVISNAVCTQTFNTYIQSSNICSVGLNGQTPCDHGDSGGPLVVADDDSQYVLVGLMSFGAHNCPAGLPTAYVRVTSYLSWISANTGVALGPR